MPTYSLTDLGDWILTVIFSGSYDALDRRPVLAPTAASKLAASSRQKLPLEARRAV
jgi:hypothetical protein